jgi:hypothetical protein
MCGWSGNRQCPENVPAHGNAKAGALEIEAGILSPSEKLLKLLGRRVLTTTRRSSAGGFDELIH